MQCFYKLACITYYQLNKDYIAEFLCVNRNTAITLCYGQCFLKKALGFDADTSANSIASNLKFEFPVFHLNEAFILKNHLLTGNAEYTEFMEAKSTAVHYRIFHPPHVDC